MLDVNHNYKKYHYFNFFAMKISNIFHKYLETWWSGSLMKRPTHYTVLSDVEEDSPAFTFYS